MLKPFQIKDLHTYSTEENLYDSSTESITSGSNADDNRYKRHGIIHMSAPEYDDIVLHHPNAMLTYLDDDDGDIITVGSSFELGQRLDEPVVPASVPQEDAPKMHLFDIRRSKSVTELWKAVERGSAIRRQHSERASSPVSSVTTKEKIPSYHNSYENSRGQPDRENISSIPEHETTISEEDRPRTEPESLLSAFEAELAKILAEEKATQSVNEQGDNTSSTETHNSQSRNQSSSMPAGWPNDLVVNVLQTVAGKMESLKSELGSKVPEVERHLRNAHNAIPGDVASSAQTALNALQAQAQNIAQLLQSASDASGQAAERVREAELRSAEQIIDGLGDMVQGFEKFGKTLFAAFEAEFKRQTNNSAQTETTNSTGATPSESSQQQVESSSAIPSQSVARSETQTNQGPGQQCRIPAGPNVDSFGHSRPTNSTASKLLNEQISNKRNVPSNSTSWQYTPARDTLFSNWPNRPAFAPLASRPVPPPSISTDFSAKQQVKRTPTSSSTAPVDTSTRSTTSEVDVRQLGPATKYLFIGNISYQVTAEVIEEVFASKGCPVQIDLPKDVFTGRHYGFGYATFESPQSAMTALEALQGAIIDGHSINLEYINEPNVAIGHGLRQRESWHPGTRQPRELHPGLNRSRDDFHSIFRGNSWSESLHDRRQETVQVGNIERRVSSDHPEESPEFAARYPSLLPTRSTGQSVEGTPNRSMTFSPDREMARFPPVSQLDAHLLANQHGFGHRKDNEGGQGRPEAPPPTAAYGAERSRQHSFESYMQQPRSQTNEGCDRTQRSGREVVDGRRYFPRHQSPQSSAIRRADTLPGSFPVDLTPTPPTLDNTDTSDKDMQAAIRQSIIDNCVDSLVTLGYGDGLEGGKQRLAIYAEAVDGKISEAIDMIEEERAAYERQDHRP